MNFSSFYRGTQLICSATHGITNGEIIEVYQSTIFVKQVFNASASLLVFVILIKYIFFKTAIFTIIILTKPMYFPAHFYSSIIIFPLLICTPPPPPRKETLARGPTTSGRTRGSLQMLAILRRKGYICWPPAICWPPPASRHLIGQHRNGGRALIGGKGKGGGL